MKAKWVDIEKNNIDLFEQELSLIHSRLPECSLPVKIKKIISKYHRECISKQECKECSSWCCSHGGFAILENVLLIYDLYRNGKLVREDYDFPIGLSFTDFVRNYFDVSFYLIKSHFKYKQFVTFHMKSLSTDGHFISIPSIGSFHETRAELFASNPWLNKGCVFLSKRLDESSEEDNDQSRGCILHSTKSETQLTAKPIDCVFHICVSPKQMKVPSPQQSKKFDKALAKYFSCSVERFLRLVGEEDTIKSCLQRLKYTEENKGLAVISLLCCWMPFIGLLMSVVALLKNTRCRWWISLIVLTSLIISILSTCIEIVTLIE